MDACFYWPEIGRFIQKDPIGDGVNWYAYAGNNPVVFIDPLGVASFPCNWYWTTVGRWGEWIDEVLLGGATARFGETAGLHEAGLASARDMYWQGIKWGAGVGQHGVLGGEALAFANRATAMGGVVTRWGPPGKWVITGGPTQLNYAASGVRQLGYEFGSAQTWRVPSGALRYPIAEEGWFHGAWKGLIGQRVLR